MPALLPVMFSLYAWILQNAGPPLEAPHAPGAALENPCMPRHIRCTSMNWATCHDRSYTKYRREMAMALSDCEFCMGDAAASTHKCCVQALTRPDLVSGTGPISMSGGCPKKPVSYSSSSISWASASCARGWPLAKVGYREFCPTPTVVGASLSCCTLPPDAALKLLVNIFYVVCKLPAKALLAGKEPP